MKTLVFILFISLSYLAYANANAREDVTKAVDSVKKTKEALDKFKDVLLKANPAQAFGKISKVLGVLGPALMAVSAVMSVVAMFLPQEDSPELKAINEGFDKVNKRLDTITSDIKDLRNIVELSSAKSAYVKCLTAIDSSYGVLLDAQKDNTKASYDYFVKHYEMSYDLASSNLYDAMTGQLGPFGFNLVNLYKDYVKCNPVLLSKFCTMGMQMLSKGLAVEGAYLGALNLTAKTKTKKEAWEGKLQIYSDACSAVIKHCEDNWKVTTGQQFRETYKKEVTSNNQQFAQKIADSLNEVAPHRSWLAVAYNDAGGFGEHAFSSYYEVDKIWNENNHDVTIFSTPVEETLVGKDFEDFKSKVDQQTTKMSNTCEMNDWKQKPKEVFGSSDLRNMLNYVRDNFYGGVVYAIRLDKNPGQAVTGNSAYSLDLQWRCTSTRYRLIVFK